MFSMQSVFLGKACLGYPVGSNRYINVHSFCKDFNRLILSLFLRLVLEIIEHRLNITKILLLMVLLFHNMKNVLLRTLINI